MAMGLKITPEELDKAALEGMMNCIREQIKAKIMEIVQPDIDAAVDAACKQFEVKVMAYKDHAAFGQVTIRAEARRV